jgi:hypothetical protein
MVIDHRTHQTQLFHSMLELLCGLFGVHHGEDGPASKTGWMSLDDSGELVVGSAAA